MVSVGDTDSGGDGGTRKRQTHPGRAVVSRYIDTATANGHGGASGIGAPHGRVKQAGFVSDNRRRHVDERAPVSARVGTFGSGEPYRRAGPILVEISVEDDPGIGVIDRDVASVAVCHMIEGGRSGPAVGSVVLGSANQPARGPHVLVDVLEFRDDQAVVDVYPAIAAIGAAEETA